jgi:hypothetical protein
MQSANPPKWENKPPNIVIKLLKAVSPDKISSLKIRDFYKPYPSWDKMTEDQKIIYLTFSFFFLESKALFGSRENGPRARVIFHWK